MGQLLSQPLTDKVIEYRELERFSYCLGSMQGYRLTQEDAHSVTMEDAVPFEDFDGKQREIDVKIFGIFDGHGGAQSSEYISKELAPIVFEELRATGNPYGKKTTEGLIIQKLKNAFLRTDHMLYHAIHRQQGSQSGSTAILAVIIENEQLYSVNTGDSRLIVSHGGYAKNLSFDHKPNHIGELIRINDAGGMVSYNRVGGVLALSRAFGDFGFKIRRYTAETKDKDDDVPPQRIVSEETQVTVEPECILHNLSIEDEFIVLACDGIWDVFKNQDVVRFIRHNLALGLMLDEITTKLLEHTLALANQITGVGFDNMSLFIVANQMEGEDMEQWYQRMKLKLELEKELI